jgi:hypothetical protein
MGEPTQQIFASEVIASLQIKILTRESTRQLRL